MPEPGEIISKQVCCTLLVSLMFGSIVRPVVALSKTGNNLDLHVRLLKNVFKTPRTDLAWVYLWDC